MPRPETRVDIEGVGVHWHCSASRGGRSCLVHCFDQRGPSFLVIFRSGDGNESAGRTGSAPVAAEAIGSWLDGREIGDLRDRFSFVDRQERALAAIGAEAVARHPELGRLATTRLNKIASDLHELIVETPDRSCRISFHGPGEFPDALFKWDECEMFWTRASDVPRLSDMLRRWLCDLAMPSEMAGEFPEIEREPVAGYYEQGRPVEGEFLASWDRIERFYRDDSDRSFSGPVLAFISEIRRAGFDRTLRAGQSLWTLVVSRSRRHGLRPDQPRVAFDFRVPSMDVTVVGRYREERFRVPRIGLQPEVLAALGRLASEPID